LLEDLQSILHWHLRLQHLVLITLLLLLGLRWQGQCLLELHQLHSTLLYILYGCLRLLLLTCLELGQLSGLDDRLLNDTHALQLLLLLCWLQQLWWGQLGLQVVLCSSSILALDHTQLWLLLDRHRSNPCLRRAPSLLHRRHI
jgi:hypothetical protein